MNWQELCLPDHSLLEIFLRGTVVYLTLFILLRAVLKREAGAVGLTDLALIVLLGNAVQNAMGSDYQSITEGILLMGCILFWSYVLNWLSFHSSRFRHLIEPPPLLLIQNGRLIPRNLRHELISRTELEALLREQGIENPHQVKRAFLENDGHLSAILFEEKENHGHNTKKGIPG